MHPDRIANTEADGFRTDSACVRAESVEVIEAISIRPARQMPFSEFCEAARELGPDRAR